VSVRNPVPRVRRLRNGLVYRALLMRMREDRADRPQFAERDRFKGARMVRQEALAPGSGNGGTAAPGDAVLPMPIKRRHADGPGDRAPGFGPSAPVRPAGDIKPLIEASTAYPVMEEMVIGAQRTAHLAFRIFDPATRARSEAARQRGFHDWGDILIDAAKRGVAVRALLSDFEPVMAHELHRLGWHNGQRLIERAQQLPEDTPGSIDLLIALHEGEMGSAARWLLWFAMRPKLSKLVRDYPDAPTYPGVAYTMAEHRPRFLPPARMWPATHHQKVMVVDGETAVVGGIDIDERRYDDPEHRQPTDQTWHDVSLRVHGPVAGDAERHFVELWNREVIRYGGGDPVAGLHLPPGHDRQTVPQPIEPAEAAAEDGPTLSGDGEASARFVRTGSVVRRGAFAITPEPVVTEIEDTVIDTIRSAKRLLYMENQFFRLRRIADEIGARMRDRPELEVILLLPMAPDMVAFENKTGPEMRFGEWLQVKAVRRLLKHGGDRVGVFSLVRRAPAEPDVTGRAKAFGSGIVYPHSKVMIADNDRAIVGSANLNGRSLRMDTEAALDWRDDPGIREFRETLFSHHLGRAYEATPPSALQLWARVAMENVHLDPEERNGFIVPYKLGAARRFARFQRFIPEVYL